MKSIMVTKRSGQREPFDPDKIHKVLFWATEDVSGVAVSQTAKRTVIAELPLFVIETLATVYVLAGQV